MRKTFRDRILTDCGGDSSIHKIRLSTNDGLTGYRVNSFQIIPADPTDTAYEVVYLLYTTKPAEVTDEINFANPALLACGLWSSSGTGASNPEDMTIIFDNTTINQDLYITVKSDGSDQKFNYLLELEQMKLTVDEAATATLKDMRATS